MKTKQNKTNEARLRIESEFLPNVPADLAEQTISNLHNLAFALSFNGQSLTRSDVAALVTMAGLGVTTGGHHVAVYPKTPTGQFACGRVAIVTGTGPDWD
jgi:hypothetical protein